MQCIARCISLHEDFVRIKTLTGLDPFEVRFFFGQKFTKINLALKWLIKSCWKLRQCVSMMVLTILEDNFLVFKWEHQSIEKFLHEVLFSVSRAQGGIQLKICFCTIKDLPIYFFLKNWFFLSQNSYGYRTLWNSFGAIFLLFGSKLKSWSQ